MVFTSKYKRQEEKKKNKQKKPTTNIDQCVWAFVDHRKYSGFYFIILFQYAFVWL